MTVKTSAKRLMAATGAAALITLSGAFAVSTFAQDPTPTAPTAPADGDTLKGSGLGRGFGLWSGGSTAQFDAVAEALNLTPTQLFEQLHSGKILEEIATAQGVDLQAIHDAANASRLEALKDNIAQAVTDGQMTQEQADWMLEGIEKGYMPLGGGGFGHGGRDGFGIRGVAPAQPSQAPTTTPGTTS
jgi:hypothetical protein